MKSGQFAFFTKQETYLRDGKFEPNRMIDFVEEACINARAAGFQGLRGTGEMTWHLGSGASLEQLLVYESRLTDDIFSRYPLKGICQYNLRRFSAELLRGILETHPVLLYKDVVCDNYFYVPREQFPNCPTRAVSLSAGSNPYWKPRVNGKNWSAPYGRERRPKPRLWRDSQN